MVPASIKDKGPPQAEAPYLTPPHHISAREGWLWQATFLCSSMPTCWYCNCLQF